MLGQELNVRVKNQIKSKHIKGLKEVKVINLLGADTTDAFLKPTFQVLELLEVQGTKRFTKNVSVQILNVPDLSP